MITQREIKNLVLQTLATKDANVIFAGSTISEMLNAWNSEGTEEMKDYQKKLLKACCYIASQQIKFNDKHNKCVTLKVIDKHRRYSRGKYNTANLYEMQECS